MVASKDYFYISPEDYLEGEKASPIKHEYIRGEIYAMAGGSDSHATICLNLATLLRNHVRGSGCRAYASDMKVHIEAANCFYYPDVMVTCDERDRTPDDFKCYPSLIVEVLSPSTEAFNRGGKFADYRTIETLREYVLISQDKVNVECFRRNEQGRWVLYTYSAGEDVCLDSINFSTPMANIYEDVAGLI